MNEFIEDLKNTNLFSDMEPQDIDGLFRCLCTERADYARVNTSLKKAAESGASALYCQDIAVPLSGIRQAD